MPGSPDATKLIFPVVIPKYKLAELKDEELTDARPLPSKIKNQVPDDGIDTTSGVGLGGVVPDAVQVGFAIPDI